MSKIFKEQKDEIERIEKDIYRLVEKFLETCAEPEKNGPEKNGYTFVRFLSRPSLDIIAKVKAPPVDVALKLRGVVARPRSASEMLLMFSQACSGDLILTTHDTGSPRDEGVLFQVNITPGTINVAVCEGRSCIALGGPENLHAWACKNRERYGCSDYWRQFYEK